MASHTRSMTAVSVAMTGTARPAALLSHLTTPGLAFYVGFDSDADPADRAALVNLARVIENVTAEMVPAAVTHSALTLGGRSMHTAIVARVREELASAEPDPFLSRPNHMHAVPDHREVIVDPAAHEVTVSGRSVQLTFKEFALLEYLLRAAHRAVTREELLTEVWHKRAWRDGTRTIDVHVRRLREKLGGCPRIVTVRGVGYRCDPTPEVVLVGSGDADRGPALPGRLDQGALVHRPGSATSTRERARFGGSRALSHHVRASSPPPQRAGASSRRRHERLAQASRGRANRRNRYGSTTQGPIRSQEPCQNR
jgi:DNA-binding winged helix-turn-helix (wHTH) protein